MQPDPLASAPATVPAFVSVDARFVRCPACAGPQLEGWVCPACGFAAEAAGGVLDLRVDKSADTLLDIEAYLETHSPARRGNDALYQSYRAHMARLGRRFGGRVLEIGAGAGNLTLPMALSGDVAELHCSDISPGFLEIMLRRLSAVAEEVPEGARVHPYLFDGAGFPFFSGQFDVVIGHSILHHIAKFEDTLAEAHRMLRPGGVAAFGEPMMDGFAFASLAAGLIVDIAAMTGDRDLSPLHIRSLEVIRDRIGVKRAQFDGDRSDLGAVEDKFVFPAAALERIGAEIGFSDVVVRRGPNSVLRLGAAVRRQIEFDLRFMTLDLEPLERYGFVFERISEQYGDPLGRDICPMFAEIYFLR